MTSVFPVSTSNPTTRSVAPLFASLMVTMLLAALNQTVLSTALPTVVGELHGIDHMTWVITGYILASTIVMPVYGRISDLLGRRPVLILAISLFVAGSVIGAEAANIEWLIVGRVIQGAGGGGLMILSQAAIADVVPARDRGKYMGLMGAVFAVASVAGPLLGGWFTEGPGWRWAFWINVPLGAVAILATLVFLRLPETPHAERPRIDYLGAALIAVATTAVILVCTWGGATYAWRSPQIIGLILATVVSALLFAAVESKATHPLIPLPLFKERNFTLSTFAALLFGIAMFGAIGYLPTYLQMSSGVNATEAGLLMIPMMGGLLGASVVCGRLVSRTGRYKRYPTAGAAVMGAGLALISTLHIDSPIWLMCGYTAILGIGIGMGMQILILIVQNTFSSAIVGTATAATNYFRQVGASVGSAVVGSVFATRLVTLLAERLPDSAGSTDTNALTPAAVRELPATTRLPILEAYNDALLPIFLFMVPLAVIAVIALAFIKETPLATTIERDVIDQSPAQARAYNPPETRPRLADTGTSGRRGRSAGTRSAQCGKTRTGQWL
ncbi:MULTISPECIES: MDR family MFS transporter [Mycolicibacterium]|uniref:MDR family MFS transporter n=1 Tax=Mycolicibacterium TaxID=1866885 RepID=UPI0021F27A02|nr:MDR family MFS transporter [Mycolicibacterium pyrenivorans]MCV7154908.1 MFS transporter [Mycolicibacterium pyrenivorans]